MTRLVARTAGLGALLLCTVALAEGKPPATHKSADDEMKVVGVLGSLDQDQVEEGFKTKSEATTACYKNASEEFGYLSGTLEIKVHVNDRGVPGTVEIVKPLGSFEVEHCIAHNAAQIAFAAPKGGATEFTYTFHFTGKPPGREWGTAEVGPTLAAHRAEVERCKTHEMKTSIPKGLRLTFYVMPGGVVAHSGVGADEPLTEEYRRCVSDRVGSWKFSDPLGKVARASYQF